MVAITKIVFIVLKFSKVTALRKQDICRKPLFENCAKFIRKD
jgi:hypothetical protein